MTYIIIFKLTIQYLILLFDSKMRNSAVNQQRYRERQKAMRGKNYLKKESERVGAYYVRSDLLSDRKRQERNQKSREAMRRRRERKKEVDHPELPPLCNTPSTPEGSRRSARLRPEMEEPAAISLLATPTNTHEDFANERR